MINDTSILKKLCQFCYFADNNFFNGYITVYYETFKEKNLQVGK